MESPGVVKSPGREQILVKKKIKAQINLKRRKGSITKLTENVKNTNVKKRTLINIELSF